MAPPHQKHADALPCSDPSHGEGFQAESERRFCKEKKALKIGPNHSVYSVHAASVAIRGGSTAPKFAGPDPTNRYLAQDKVQLSTKRKTSNMQLPLPELDAAARASFPGGERVAVKTPTRATLAATGDATAQKTAPKPAGSSNKAAASSAKTEKITTSGAGYVDLYPKNFMRDLRITAASNTVKAKVDQGQHHPTPPAALSDKGRKLAAAEKQKQKQLAEEDLEWDDAFVPVDKEDDEYVFV